MYLPVETINCRGFYEWSHNREKRPIRFVIFVRSPVRAAPTEHLFVKYDTERENVSRKYRSGYNRVKYGTVFMETGVSSITAGSIKWAYNVLFEGNSIRLLGWLRKHTNYAKAPPCYVICSLP